MVDLRSLLAACGGLAPTWRLVELGASRSSVAWAAAHDVIRRVRSGWYVLPETPVAMQQAARVGGRLTESSAASASGVWAPPTMSLHVALAPNACRPRERNHYRLRLREDSRPPVTLHWNDDMVGGNAFVVDVSLWLREVVRTRSLPIVSAVADSALHCGVLDRVAWEHFRLSLAPPARAALRIVDGVPETGTESAVRTALHLAGVEARPQVWVTDHIRVDLLVDWVVIEIHSETYHGSQEQRLRDLRRTAELVRLGYTVLVFDYVQVMSDLAGVVATILAALR